MKGNNGGWKISLSHLVEILASKVLCLVVMREETMAANIRPLRIIMKSIGI